MNTPSFQVLRLLCCAWVITLFACTQQDPIEKQIDLLLSQMTIEEKIGQMNQVDPSWEAEPKEQLIREGKVGSVFNVVGAKK
jgi:beta-glucosidase